MQSYTDSQRIRVLAYSALCIALSVILSQITLFEMPQGGKVTPCSAFFISLVGYWFGLGPGMIAGVAAGFIRLSLGGYVVHPIQLILDFPLAMAMLGLSGVFRQQKYGLYVGYIVGHLGALLCHFVAGVVFFAEYAEGNNVLIYSLVYNASHVLPEMVLTMILISIPAFRKAISKIQISLAVL